MKTEQIEMLETCQKVSPETKAIPPTGIKSFAQSLAAIRSQREYSIAEMLEITRDIPRSSLLHWLGGKRMPSTQKQAEIIGKLSSDSNPPSAETRRRVENSHHLIWDKTKGWETRITIDVGKKLVGKRVRIRLKTRNLEEAIARRDILIAGYKELSLTIRDRRQKKWSKLAPKSGKGDKGA